MHQLNVLYLENNHLFFPSPNIYLTVVMFHIDELLTVYSRPLGHSVAICLQVKLSS